jgi:hypothetical protein
MRAYTPCTRRLLTAPVAGVLAEAGQHQQAAAMASQAETAARTISTGPDGQARALTAVAGALAEAGRHERPRP